MAARGEALGDAGPDPEDTGWEVVVGLDADDDDGGESEFDGDGAEGADLLGPAGGGFGGIGGAKAGGEEVELMPGGGGDGRGIIDPVFVPGEGIASPGPATGEYAGRGGGDGEESLPDELASFKDRDEGAALTGDLIGDDAGDGAVGDFAQGGGMAVEEDLDAGELIGEFQAGPVLGLDGGGEGVVEAVKDEALAGSEGALGLGGGVEERGGADAGTCGGVGEELGGSLDNELFRIARAAEVTAPVEESAGGGIEGFNGQEEAVVIEAIGRGGGEADVAWAGGGGFPGNEGVGGPIAGGKGGGFSAGGIGVAGGGAVIPALELMNGGGGEGIGALGGDDLVRGAWVPEEGGGREDSGVVDGDTEVGGGGGDGGQGLTGKEGG